MESRREGTADERKVVRGRADGCARRNESDWRALIARHGGRIRAGVRMGLARAGARRSRIAAGDVEQDVYVRLLEGDGRAMRGFKGESEAELGSYLFRIAERVAFDRVRYARAAKRDVPCTVTETAEDGAANEEIADVSCCPEGRLLAAEQLAAFRRACVTAAGPGRRRRDVHILELAFVWGYSSREIAERCPGLSASGVDTVVSRARLRLRAQGVVMPVRHGRWTARG